MVKPCAYLTIDLSGEDALSPGAADALPAAPRTELSLPGCRQPNTKGNKKITTTIRKCNALGIKFI